MRRTRAIASKPNGFARLARHVFFVLLALAAVPAAAEAFCGSAGQRACCLAENGFPFGGCSPSAVTVPQANSGLCSGFNPLMIQASAICVAPTPCGSSGQRACCAGEAGFVFGGCSGGFNPVSQPNSGYCTNSSLGIQSSSVCVPITACGGVGQRACCVGENGFAFGGCSAGGVTVPQANAGQCSNSLIGIQSSAICVASTPCGGSGQRACCAGEAGFPFGGCSGGFNPVSQANSGYCTNSSTGIQSSSVCVPITACGGVGQRACCVGENGFAFGGCSAGGVTVPQANAGQCSNSLIGIQSSAICVASTPCGGSGQRACCAGEAGFVFGGCSGGFNPVSQANSGYCTNSSLGIQSSSVCVPVTACGGVGQRACCVGENGFAFGGCSAGGVTVPQANAGQCSNSLIGIQSSAICVASTPCGGSGQRACCAGEAGFPFGGCSGGFNPVSQANSGYCTNSSTGIQSSSVCVPVTACGGVGQRACCVGENGFAFGGCSAGGVTVPQANAGQCSNSLIGIQSSAICVASTPCGGSGQRGCCLGEAGFVFGGCSGGFNPVPQANSGYCTNSSTGIQSSSVCVPVTPCGGPGERACCFLEAGFGACVPPLVEVPLPNAGQCANSLPGIQSSGACAPISPCGAKGQRACCGSEGVNCQAGLIEVPGCSGDCACGGGISSSGMCTVIEPIAEPGTNWSPPSQGPATPLRGFADLHLHLFANFAHGGGVLAGEAFDAQGGVNAALKQDYGTNLDLVDKNGLPLVTPNCPAFLPNCGAGLYHGDHNIVGAGSDQVGAGTKDGGDRFGFGAESNLGAPIFNGWPTWTSTTHQQAYHAWLERAWRGGMRLTVMLAVTNEALCRTSKRLRGTDCNDGMAAIDAQLAEARAFESFVDGLFGGPGKGYFRIVTTPAQARDVIAQGKLAVVLGIEMDNLFNCKFDERDPNTGRCTDASVRTFVNQAYANGVRHIFPVHNFENAFGSPATWQDAIHVGNRGVEGKWWDAEDCPGEEYGFKLNDGFFTGLFNLLMSLFGFGVGEVPATPPGDASCNSFGLAPLGYTLIDQMIQKGMIIDVDHMSVKAFDQTLKIAESTSPPYPVVASHVQFLELNREQTRHERMRTRAQLERIRGVGGMVAAMLKDDQQDTDNIGQKFNIPYGSVADDCRHSSKTWAQAYRYAVDVMGGPVAFGSDFNGVAGHVGPRFGSEGCGGDPGLVAFEFDARLSERAQQLRAGNQLRYPFAIPGFGTFDRQATGHKTFDFNFDGLAHIGLLPDLVADLQAVGLSERELDPLFQSAEAYVALWERAISGACPSGPGNDFDGDGIGDACDNCRYKKNADQLDRGGVGSGSAPDGIGDICQCGDVTGDGRVTLSDAVTVQRSLLLPPTAVPLRPELCDVNASGTCSIADAVVTRRTLLSPPTATVQQQCRPALP